MSQDTTLAALPLHGPEDAPAFDRPWQAQAFALTVELHKRGLFSWPDWVETFSTQIKAAPAGPDESVNDAYFRQWLAALERMTARVSPIAPDEIAGRAEEWRQAYLNTPHGHPVLLANAACAPGHHHHHAPSRKPVAVSPAIPA